MVPSYSERHLWRRGDSGKERSFEEAPGLPEQVSLNKATRAAVGTKKEPKRNHHDEVEHDEVEHECSKESSSTSRNSAKSGKLPKLGFGKKDHP